MMATPVQTTWISYFVFIHLFTIWHCPTAVDSWGRFVFRNLDNYPYTTTTTGYTTDKEQVAWLQSTARNVNTESNSTHLKAGQESVKNSSTEDLKRSSNSKVKPDDKPTTDPSENLIKVWERVEEQPKSESAVLTTDNPNPVQNKPYTTPSQIISLNGVTLSSEREESERGDETGGGGGGREGRGEKDQRMREKSRKDTVGGKRKNGVGKRKGGRRLGGRGRKEKREPEEHQLTNSSQNISAAVENNDNNSSVQVEATTKINNDKGMRTKDNNNNNNNSNNVKNNNINNDENNITARTNDKNNSNVNSCNNNNNNNNKTRSLLPQSSILLSVQLSEEGHSVRVSWKINTSANITDQIQGFVVSYKMDGRENYDSSRLGKEVRTFFLHSLHKDKYYSICVRTIGGSQNGPVQVPESSSTTDDELCVRWSKTSMKIVIGVVAGLIFLVPCLLILVWVIYKDRKMKALNNNSDGSNDKDALIKETLGKRKIISEKGREFDEAKVEFYGKEVKFLVGDPGEKSEESKRKGGEEEGKDKKRPYCSRREMAGEEAGLDNVGFQNDHFTVHMN